MDRLRYIVEINRCQRQWFLNYTFYETPVNPKLSLFFLSNCLNVTLK